MESAIVDRLHSEYRDLLDYLDANTQISLRASADDNFRKALLLSAASYFEHSITECLTSFLSDVTDSHALLCSFVRSQAIVYQYSKWFDWEGNNANKFFAMFGSDFKIKMRKGVKDDPKLDEAIKAFLEIGNERNRLVHQNFASFTLEKTADDIYASFLKARYFVDSLPVLLREKTEAEASPN